MAGRRVLLVGQDKVLERTLREQLLAHDDFKDVETALTAEEGVSVATSQRFDVLIILNEDFNNGARGFLASLRAQNCMWPALVLATSGAVAADYPETLGIIDVLVKPFRLQALFPRLRSLIRAFENSDDAVLTIGPYTFQPASKHLEREDGGEGIRLTEKEAAILKYLYRAGDSVVARDTLLHEVWGYNPAVTTHTLETHVYRLRQKIEDNPSEATILVTDAGGYRLVP
jgi:DNA-binding response OmpR family regulator